MNDRGRLDSMKVIDFVNPKPKPINPPKVIDKKLLDPPTGQKIKAKASNVNHFEHQLERLYICSGKRDKNLYPKSNEFRLPLDMRGVRRFKVLEISIPYTFYNIPEDTLFYYNGASYNVTAGYYELAVLMSTLQTLTGDSFTQDSITGKVSITGVTPTIDQVNLISKILGFTETNVAGGITITGQELPNNNLTTDIFVHSNMVLNPANLSGDRYDILQHISFDQNFGTLIKWQNFGHDKWHEISQKNSSQFIFSLRDMDNNLIDLNGHDYSINLIIEKERDNING